ncbi:hypothetical protein NHX12_005281 [Muraenolepis orangiensis]|uniref:Uncharacterized protein n=1 Tax=Muraenolepis orangiensis TaxID=630683 RepID=A0A9Q0DR89_9TELE|nr:hypothetical protein NHX12_005281 [Muraenolepis orangiensis]
MWRPAWLPLGRPFRGADDDIAQRVRGHLETGTVQGMKESSVNVCVCVLEAPRKCGSARLLSTAKKGRRAVVAVAVVEVEEVEEVAVAGAVRRVVRRAVAVAVARAVARAVAGGVAAVVVSVVQNGCGSPPFPPSPLPPFPPPHQPPPSLPPTSPGSGSGERGAYQAEQIVWSECVLAVTGRRPPGRGAARLGAALRSPY